MKKNVFILSAAFLMAFAQKSTAQVTGASGSVGLPTLPKGDTKVTNTTVIPQTQYWLRYYNRIIFNEKWILHTELEDRRYFKPNRAYQTMLPRIHMHYILGSGWEVLVGYAHFTNTQPVNSPQQSKTLNVPEERPMVGFEYRQVNKRLEFNHRYWMEERFQHNYNSSTLELTKGYNFILRGRYRLQVQYAIIKKDNLKGMLRLNISNEIFINLSKSAIINTFDQNRFFVGLNYGLSKSFVLEAGWYKIYQASSSTVGTFYNRDAIRVTLQHYIRVKKKENKENIDSNQ